MSEIPVSEELRHEDFLRSETGRAVVRIRERARLLLAVEERFGRLHEATDELVQVVDPLLLETLQPLVDLFGFLAAPVERDGEQRDGFDCVLDEASERETFRLLTEADGVDFSGALAGTVEGVRHARSVLDQPWPVKRGRAGHGPADPRAETNG